MKFIHPFFLKKIPTHLRSCSEIMKSAKKKKDKNEISTLQYNSKTHATLNKKTYVSLYAEDSYFLTTRAGWKVTKIYDHLPLNKILLKETLL